MIPIKHSTQEVPEREVQGVEPILGKVYAKMWV